MTEDLQPQQTGNQGCKGWFLHGEVVLMDSTTAEISRKARDMGSSLEHNDEMRERYSVRIKAIHALEALVGKYETAEIHDQDLRDLILDPIVSFLERFYRDLKGVQHFTAGYERAWDRIENMKPAMIAAFTAAMFTIRYVSPWRMFLRVHYTKDQREDVRVARVGKIFDKWIEHVGKDEEKNNLKTLFLRSAKRRDGPILRWATGQAYREQVDRGLRAELKVWGIDVSAIEKRLKEEAQARAKELSTEEKKVEPDYSSVPEDRGNEVVRQLQSLGGVLGDGTLADLKSVKDKAEAEAERLYIVDRLGIQWQRKGVISYFGALGINIKGMEEGIRKERVPRKDAFPNVLGVGAIMVTVAAGGAGSASRTVATTAVSIYPVGFACAIGETLRKTRYQLGRTYESIVRQVVENAINSLEQGQVTILDWRSARDKLLNPAELMPAEIASKGLLKEGYISGVMFLGIRYNNRLNEMQNAQRLLSYLLGALSTCDLRRDKVSDVDFPEMRDSVSDVITNIIGSMANADLEKLYRMIDSLGSLLKMIEVREFTAGMPQVSGDLLLKLDEIVGAIDADGVDSIGIPSIRLQEGFELGTRTGRLRRI
ncbi:MAG: hypothetical protein PHS44_00665 [Candidatus Dojkabacteria bacterium]|nr:hypothetical protein [Candidatus Dojkabacteria bacterium]